MSSDNVEQARAIVAGARRVTVLTGAGISTDAGIPDFRGPHGVWTKNPKAEKISTLSAYLGDREVRELAWQSRLRSPMWEARPTPGHLALVELERRGTLHAIVTQNIDRLHHKAGNDPSRIFEVHGNALYTVCWSCGDTAEMDRLVSQALRGSDAEIRRAKDNGASDPEIAAFDIQKLTITLLFGGDVSGARRLIESSTKAGALGEQGKARFEAMLDWREGRLDKAIAALQPFAEEDPLARYAHACALLEAKRVPEAAAELRSVATSHVGTSIGLLALDRLAEALGQKELATGQLSPEIAARAEAMERSLAQHLPKAVDAIVEAPMRAISVDLAPSSTTVRPFEPLDMRIRIRNTSRLPLAVGADAPISGTVTCAPRRRGPAATRGRAS